MKKLLAFITGALIAAVLVFSFYDQISGAIKKPDEEKKQTEQTETVAEAYTADALRVGSDMDSTGYYLKTGANVSISEIRYKAKRDDDVSIPTYSVTMNAPVIMNRYVGGGYQNSEYELKLGTEGSNSFMYDWSTNHFVEDDGQTLSLQTAGLRLYISVEENSTELFALNFDFPANTISRDGYAVTDPSMTVTGGTASNLQVTVHKPLSIQVDQSHYEKLMTAQDKRWTCIYYLQYICALPHGGYAAESAKTKLDCGTYAGGGNSGDYMSYQPFRYLNGGFVFSSTYFTLSSTAIAPEDVTLTLSDLEKKNTYTKPATVRYDGAWLVFTLKDTEAFDFLGFNEAAFLCSFSSENHGTWTDNHVPLNNNISTVTHDIKSWKSRWVRSGAYVKLVNSYSGAEMKYITALTKPEVGNVPIHLEDTDEDLRAFLEPYNPEKEMLIVTFDNKQVERERFGETDTFHTEYAVPDNAVHDYTVTVYVSKTKRPVEEGSGVWASIGGFFKSAGNKIGGFFGDVWGGIKTAGSKIGDFFFGDDGVVDTVKGVFSGIGSGFSYFGLILVIGVIVLALVIVVPLFRR